jgi:Fe2+ transport system protein B
LTLALAGVTLAWMASRFREPRFLFAAAVSLVVGVATVLFRLAPLAHLFHAQADPGNGALAALFVAGAAACVAALAGTRAGGGRRPPRLAVAPQLVVAAVAAAAPFAWFGTS